MLDTTHRGGEGTASVSKRDLQLWESLQDSSHDHGTDRDRGLTGHADQPREPVLFHATLAVHIPRVHKDHRIRLLAGSPDGVQLGRIQVPVIDVASNLDTRQSKLLTATFQFLDGQQGGLHGQGAETDKALGILGHHLGNVIVQVPGQIQGMFRTGSVVEHDGHSRENL